MRGFEEERTQLHDDVNALQKSSAAKTIELQRVSQEATKAQSERHSTMQQVPPPPAVTPASLIE